MLRSPVPLRGAFFRMLRRLCGLLMLPPFLPFFGLCGVLGSGDMFKYGVFPLVASKTLPRDDVTSNALVPGLGTRGSVLNATLRRQSLTV